MVNKMAKIGRFLNKIKTGKKHGNKRISKFSPVFLISIITVIAFIALAVTGSFNTIFQKLFKEGTFTEEVLDYYQELESPNESFGVYTSYIDTDFAVNKIAANFELSISGDGTAFHNKDFIVIVNSYKDIAHDDNMKIKFSNLARNVLSSNDNRIAFLFANSSTSDFNDYKNDINDIETDIENITLDYSTKTNIYKEVYEFLQNHPPVNNRETIIMHYTDYDVQLSQYAGYYRLLKRDFSDVSISFIRDPYATFEEQEYLEVADKLFFVNNNGDDPINLCLYYYGYGLTYNDAVIEVTLSDDVELDSYVNKAGGTEVLEDNNHKTVVRFTIPKVNLLTSYDKIQIIVNIKENTPDYVSLFNEVSLDYTNEANQRKHHEKIDPIVISQYYEVEYITNAPEDCDIPATITKTYKKGTAANLEDAPVCAGYQFREWGINYEYSKPTLINGNAFTSFTEKAGFRGSWEKITLHKDFYGEIIAPD